MKKLLIILSFILLGHTCFAEVNQRFQGMYFSPIYTDMYKRPVITWKDHDKIVNYHEGAIKYCESKGMRLPSKDEANLLTEYLNNTQTEYRRQISFWMKENATGKFDNITISSTNGYAYVLNYNNIIYPIQSYLLPWNKTSANASGVSAICVKEAPPITINEKITLIKEDYNLYINNGKSVYGVLNNSIKNLPLGFN